MKLPAHQVLYVRSMGKALRVTAIFTDDDDTNAYLAKNRDESVVAVFGDFILIANTYDHGINLPRG